MKALFWKDCRLNLLILVLGTGMLLGPHLGGVLWEIYDHWPVFPSATTWARLLFLTSYASLALSQLTLVLLGGNAIAAERADRSAEFLAYLPPSRAQIVVSKILLALATGLVVWAANLLLADVVVPVLSSEEPDVWGLPSRWRILAGSLFVFGAGWFGSSFLGSPTFATSLGIVAPFLLALVLVVCTLLFAWPAHGTLGDVHCNASLILGPVCFAVGTCYYLRRVEP
jgi:ABC-type transport system involved in multi-copper enzyme maturation permease subunit